MKRRILKKIVMTVVSCGFVANASAIGNGFYMGLMMGPATNSSPSLDAQIKLTPPNPDCSTSTTYLPNCLQTTRVGPRSTQFGSRIFIGNKFNTYAAIEGGVTFISKIKYEPIYKSGTTIPTLNGGAEQRVRDLDIVAKGIYPFYGFDIFGKAGIAVTYVTTGSALNPTYTPASPATGTGHPPNGGHQAQLSGSNEYRQKYSPTISFGASYDINQSWVVDASYNRIEIGDSIGSVIFYSIGLSYHITDKYCGQFLCDD